MCLQLMSAKETVKVMIDHMTNPENSTHLAVKKGGLCFSLSVIK